MKTNNQLATIEDLDIITDENLVRRILSGETEMFEFIMRRHNRLLYRIAYAVLQNSSEAEEVVQESYVRAYTHLSQFAGRSKLSTWLAKIALHTAQAYSRRRSRIVSFESIPDSSLPAQIHRSNPEKKLLESEIKVALNGAIAKLPEIYRSVFDLREIKSLDTAETASALGVTEEVVKTRLHRARIMLRKHLYSFMEKLGSEPVLAIDLGTANVRVYVHGRGVILDEPSLIRIDSKTGLIQSVGTRAIQSFNSADSYLASPLQAGVIADVDQTASLLRPLIERAVRKLGFKKPKALICIPSDATKKEFTDLVDATLRSGISSVAVVPEPMAAAIGAGIDGSSGYANMLIDVGEGVTDIAVLKSGTIVKSGAVRIACNNFHSSLQSKIEEGYGIQLQNFDVRALTQQLCLQTFSDTETILINGIDSITNREKEIDIRTDELLNAFTPIADTILKSTQSFLRDLPDQISCEVIENGIYLTGGGAFIPGLADRIEKDTSIVVHRAADPLNAVIDGARQMVATGLSTDLWKTHGYS